MEGNIICSFGAARGPVALPPLTVDEFTHEAQAIRVSRKLKAADVIDVLSDLFMMRRHSRPHTFRLPMVAPLVRATIGDGPEFIARAVQEWIAAVGARTAYIAPGSPWENGCIESFNACLRDELLDGEIFYTLSEARIGVESGRRHYNTVRPHGSPAYRPPAPEVFVPALAAWPSSPTRTAATATLPLAQRPVMHQHPTWTTRCGPIKVAQPTDWPDMPVLRDEGELHVFGHSFGPMAVMPSLPREICCRFF